MRDRGLLAVDLDGRVGRVEQQELEVVPEDDVDAALAAVFEPLQQFVLDLEIVGIVVFARLQHGARRRDRVAAALQFDGVEERPVREMVGLVALAAQRIAGAEIDEGVRARADRGEVRRRVAGFRSRVVGEQVLRDDAAGLADEGIGPERRRLGEGHLDGEVVDLVDRHVLVAADRRRGRGRILRILPREDEIVGGHGLAVLPLRPRLQLPHDRLAVARYRAVLDGRDLGGQHRQQVAVVVPGGQRLVEDPAGLLVLGADREMRVQKRRCLPEQQLQRSAAARLGGLVGVAEVGRIGCVRMGQHQSGQRRRQAQGHHALHEAAPG